MVTAKRPKRGKVQVRKSTKKKVSSFGIRLRSARVLRGLGSRELALRAKGDVTAVSRIETGRNRKVCTEFAGRLARALAVSPLWLCWGLGKPEDIQRAKPAIEATATVVSANS